MGVKLQAVIVQNGIQPDFYQRFVAFHLHFVGESESIATGYEHHTVGFMTFKVAYAALNFVIHASNYAGADSRRRLSLIHI